MMKKIIKLSFIFLLSLSSCKKIIKEAIKEVTETSLKKEVKQVAKSSIKNEGKHLSKKIAEETVETSLKKEVKKVDKNIGKQLFRKDMNNFISINSKEWHKRGINLVSKKNVTEIQGKSGEVLGKIFVKGDKHIIQTYSLVGKKSVNPILNVKRLPNSTYKVENSIFKTDKLGRVIYAKKPVITKNEIHRNSLQGSYKSKIKNIQDIGGIDGLDDKGHIIAHSLGGNSGKLNIVPQSKNINRQGKSFAKVEELIKKHKEYIKNYEVDLSYKGNSRRPYSFMQKFEYRGKKEDLIKFKQQNKQFKYFKKTDINGNTFFDCSFFHLNK